MRNKQQKKSYSPSLRLQRFCSLRRCFFFLFQHPARPRSPHAGFHQRLSNISTPFPIRFPLSLFSLLFFPHANPHSFTKCAELNLNDTQKGEERGKNALSDLILLVSLFQGAGDMAGEFPWCVSETGTGRESSLVEYLKSKPSLLNAFSNRDTCILTLCFILLYICFGLDMFRDTCIKILLCQCYDFMCFWMKFFFVCFVCFI